MSTQLAGVLLFSVKPISGKYSWTTHVSEERAQRAAYSHQANKAAGRHQRFAYRVNVRVGSTIDEAIIKLWWSHYNSMGEIS